MCYIYKKVCVGLDMDFNSLDAQREAGLNYIASQKAEGWISDKIFKGKRAPVNAIFMALTALAIVVYWLNPKGSPMIDMIALFAIGFLIYGPVMLIGLQALDMVSKKAAGTAAGFTGFFGYFLGTATLANLGMGYVTEHLGWDWSFAIIISACIITILIMIKCAIDERKQA